MVMAAILAALTLAGTITVWEIYFFALLMGCAQAVGGPARHALVFEMVGPEDLRERRQPQLEPRHRSPCPRARDRRHRRRGRGGRCRLRHQLPQLPRRGRGPARARHDEAPPGDSRPRSDRRRRGARRPQVRGPRPAAQPLRSSPCSCSRRSRSTSTCSCRSSPSRRSTGRRTFGLIAAVFGAGALLGATANAARGPREPARPAARRARLRDLRARARAARLAGAGLRGAAS